MPSFLSIPALSNSQVAETAGAVTSGFRAGEAENKDAADRAAVAQDDAAKAKAAAAEEQAKTDATIREKRIGRVEQLNANNYKAAAGDLSSKISAQENLLSNPYADKTTPEYKQVSNDLANNRALLANLNSEHTQFESGNDTGAVETFDPKYSNAPQAPPFIPLDALGQQLRTAKENEVLYGGAMAKGNFDAKYGPNATQKPTKVPADLVAAANTYSGAQSLLTTQAQRVADLETAWKNNPSTGAFRALATAREDLEKTRDAAQSGYSRTVNGIASGAFGEDVRSAYAQLAGSLPAGADPTAIENQGKFRAALEAKGGNLSPAEQKINALLRGDQDVSAAWGAPAMLTQTSTVANAIANEDKPFANQADLDATRAASSAAPTPLMPAPPGSPTTPAPATAPDALSTAPASPYQKPNPVGFTYPPLWNPSMQSTQTSTGGAQ